MSRIMTIRGLICALCNISSVALQEHIKKEANTHTVAFLFDGSAVARVHMTLRSVPKSLWGTCVGLGKIGQAVASWHRLPRIAGITAKSSPIGDKGLISNGQFCNNVRNDHHTWLTVMQGKSCSYSLGSAGLSVELVLKYKIKPTGIPTNILNVEFGLFKDKFG